MSETNATQVVEIQKQIELLKAKRGASTVLDIEEVAQTVLIQLGRFTTQGKTRWQVNIPTGYPFKESPEKALPAIGMKFPQTWKIESFEAGEMASFSVPETDLSTLPQFIHDLFIKLFKLPPTYTIKCGIYNL